MIREMKDRERSVPRKLPSLSSHPLSPLLREEGRERGEEKERASKREKQGARTASSYSIGMAHKFASTTRKGLAAVCAQMVVRTCASSAWETILSRTAETGLKERTCERT